MEKKVIKINKIAENLGVNPQEIAIILQEIINNGEKFGFVDDENMIFYQFTENEYQNLITKFNNSKFTLSEGIEIFSKLVKDFKIDTNTLKKIILFLKKNQKIKGTFNAGMSEFIAFNILYQTILTTLFNVGKVSPKEIAEECNVSENIIREVIIELQTNNKIKGIYINEGRDYIIYETLKNEILNLIDKEFGITIPLLVSHLNISEEVISKIIDDLLYDEMLFVQNAPIGNEVQYITHSKISQEILTALKHSDRKDITEISSRFNIPLDKTNEILKELVAQGKIIGFINERTNEFIQESQEISSSSTTSVPLNTILFAENFTVKIKERIILDNISFYLQENEILGIVGPSGAGKTTFLKAIIGQIPIDKGKVSIAGYNIKDHANLSKIMGYVPQDLSTIYPNFSIIKNMEHFGKQYDLSIKDIKNRSKKILTELKIFDLADELVKNLSGGEKRRASIGISIIHYPKILFLDEPTSGLDPVLRKEFWNTLIKLNENYKMTLIVVTHYPDELQFASKVILFGKIEDMGKILAIGTPKDLLFSLPGNGRVILIELKKSMKDSIKILKQTTKIETILEERKDEKFRIFTDVSMKEVVNLIINSIKFSEIRNISQVEANMVDFFRLKVEKQ